VIRLITVVERRVLASVACLIRSCRPASIASLLRVTMMQSARRRLSMGSRRIPAGKSPPFPNGFVASRVTMSKSRAIRTC